MTKNVQFLQFMCLVKGQGLHDTIQRERIDAREGDGYYVPAMVCIGGYCIREFLCRGKVKALKIN